MLLGQNNLHRGGKKFCSTKVLSHASESGKCFQDRTISLRVVLKFVPQKYCHLPASLGNAFRTEQSS